MYELRKDYQLPAHLETIAHCKKTSDPAFHDQSVGAGKSILIAFFAKHVADKGGKVLVLARQGTIQAQNSDDAWAIGLKNSVYSASLNKKSTYYPVIFGTEGTVARSILTSFKSKKHDVLLIDEMHEVDWENLLLCMDDMKKGIDFYNKKNSDGKPIYSQYSVIITHNYKLNPKLRVIGYSGSPFRGANTVLGDFWKKRLSQVNTMYLVNLGFLVPPVFGFGDDEHSYDLSEFNVSNNENNGDFSAKDMQAMNRKVTKEKNKTQAIMEEVVNRTKDRLSVLITCAGKKHCQDVADCLPDGSWGIVTDSTSTKEKIKILEDARKGEIKYVIQINCLGQGVNVTRWDTLVILRKIGSLRYLIQLTGRVLRQLKNFEVDLGWIKHDGLVLDYSGTFESMGDIFDDPIVSQAVAAKAKDEGKKPLECPACGTHNGEYSVRCCGTDESSTDGRCEYFFKYNECKSCGAKNAPTAKSCRSCDAVMIDPNAALVNKAYTDADYKCVKKMSFSETKTGKLKVTYDLDSTYFKNGEEFPEIANEYFTIGGDKRPHERAMWFKFIEQHINGRDFRRRAAAFRSVKDVITMKAMFDVPSEITHRKNDKGFSIISRKKFNSGREAFSG